MFLGGIWIHVKVFQSFISSMQSKYKNRNRLSKLIFHTSSEFETSQNLGHQANHNMSHDSERSFCFYEGKCFWRCIVDSIAVITWGLKLLTLQNCWGSFECTLSVTNAIWIISGISVSQNWNHLSLQFSWPKKSIFFLKKNVGILQ